MFSVMRFGFTKLNLLNLALCKNTIENSFLVSLKIIDLLVLKLQKAL